MPTIFERDCNRCGKRYRGTGKAFCSMACMGRASSRRATFACRGCGAQCDKPLSQRKNGAAFCSARCWYAFSKGKGLTGKITIQDQPCKCCGEIFKARPTSEYCSRACINKGRPSPKRIGRVDVVCGICGTTFSKLQCQINAGRGRFCSRSCRAYHSLRTQGRLIASGIETRFFEDCKIAGAALNTQVRKGPFAIDALSSSGTTAFEFDGTYWHSLPASGARDARKDAFLRSIGIDVIRIPEALYKTNPSAAINLVVAACGGRQ